MFTLRRLVGGPNSTPGELLGPDGAKLCATLERAWLNNKVGESRIPPGSYPLRLKRIGESRFDEHYRRMFGEWHVGMIEIDQVPGRDQILFHLANWYFQLEGCVATGTSTAPHGKADFGIPAGESRPGYLIAYPPMMTAIKTKGATLTVIDPVPDGAALVA